MRIWIQMDVRAAMALGREVRTWEPVEVDLGVLTEEERVLLSTYVRERGYSDSTVPQGAWALDRVGIESLPGSRSVALPLSTEATVGAVQALLALIPGLIAQAQEERERAAQEEREREAERAAKRAAEESREARERAEALAALARMSTPDLVADATEEEDGRLSTDYHHRWRDLLRAPESRGSGYPHPEHTCDEALPYAQRIQEVVEAHNRLADEADHRERQEWANRYGSARLQRCLREGIECEAIYRDERLALERQGWQWSSEVPGDHDEPRNPPDEAFALLDRARAFDGEAALRWWTATHTCDAGCYGDDCPEYDRAEYCAISTFLGREIVMFESQEAQAQE